MPLIKCDECGRKVSDRSIFCPNCGHPTHLNKDFPRPGETPEAFTALADKVAAIRPEPEPAKAPEPVKPVEEPAPEAVEQPSKAEEPAPETPAPPEEEIFVNEEDIEAGPAPADHTNRAKVWVYMIVSLGALAVILYFYFTAPPVANEDAEAEDYELNEQTLPEEGAEVFTEELAADSVEKAEEGRTDAILRPKHRDDKALEKAAADIKVMSLREMTSGANSAADSTAR